MYTRLLAYRRNTISPQLFWGMTCHSTNSPGLPRYLSFLAARYISTSASRKSDKSLAPSYIHNPNGPLIDTAAEPSEEQLSSVKNRQGYFFLLAVQNDPAIALMRRVFRQRVQVRMISSKFQQTYTIRIKHMLYRIPFFTMTQNPFQSFLWTSRFTPDISSQNTWNNIYNLYTRVVGASVSAEQSIVVGIARFRVCYHN